MYGKSKYGTNQYASTINGEENQEKYYIDLIQYVPPFIASLEEMQEIYDTEGYEIGAAHEKSEDNAKQWYVSTATWGLALWENVYGIATNFSLSHEQRREIILAKMRGQGTTTVEMIKNAAEAFSGGEVEVVEDNGNYHFIVRFIGILGIPRNMQAFINMLEELKPAHLRYTFEYKYVIWNDLIPYIWEELEPYTWNGLRVMEIIPFVAWDEIYEQYIWENIKFKTWNKIQEK